jgi:hypothetical protein
MNKNLDKHLEEAKKFVNEEDARTAYLRCREDRDEPLIAEEVHIVEFAENLIALVGDRISKAEFEACYKVVHDLNPEVANKLKAVRGKE